MTPAALWTAAVATAAAILSFDLLLPLGVAGGVPYVLLVLLALKSPSRNAALGLAAAGSVLTVFGFFLSEPGSTLWIVLTNRTLAVLVIWISVLPVVRYQRIRFGNVVARIDVEDIMNSMMEAIFISDERTIILAVNESAEAMFGYSAKELVGKSAAVLRPEPERSRHQAANEEFQRTGRTTFAGRGLIEERGLRKDGSIFPMEMQVGKLWRNGQLYFVSTTRDVSARIEAENSQRQTQELFEKAFHLSPHPASLTRTSDRRFIDVNEAWLRAMGRTREEAIGATADELGIWTDTARRDELYGIVDTAQSVHDFDAVWQAKDGRCVDVVVSVERLALDDGSANLLIAYDQTESKKVEKALRESEERFTKAFQGAPLMTILLWLEDGRCIDVNDAWLEGMGYPREAVVGRPSSELPLWVDPDRRLMAYKLLREPGSLRQFEAQWRKRDGSVIDVILHAERLDLDGKQAALSIARDVTVERRTEAALRESEDRFAKAFHVSPLMTTLLWLEDGRRIDVNDAWLEGTGYSRDEIVGRTSNELPLWVDPDRRVMAHQLLRETGSLRGFEAQWRKKDGSVIDVLLHAERLDLDGKQAALSIARDVTVERRTEAALRESEERFTKAFQGAPLMMCLMNLENFEYLDVNDAWSKGVGHSREEIVGRTSSEFPLWVNEAQRTEAHKTIRETGSLRAFEAKWRRSDDAIFDVRIQAELLDIDGEPAVLSISRDITEEKRAEKALLQSEERFRDVAEISSDWIWETDASNRISYISDRIRDALGFDPKVVIGSIRGTSDRIADKGSKAWQRHLKVVEARRPFKNFVYQHYDREGGIRHIQISGKPVFGEDGAFMGHRGVGSDITQRREFEMAKARAEQEREQARQRLQAVMDSVLEGIVTIDEHGIIESINPAGIELFGYAGNDLTGQNVSLLMPGAKAKKHDGYLDRYVRTGERHILEKPREVIARRRDGSEFLIELRVSETRIGESRRFVGAIRDLTKSKNAEEALRRSEEYLRAVIENSTDVISIVDAEGMIRFESPAIERISGLTRAELKGYHVSDRAHYDDRAKVRAAFARVVEKPGRVEAVEYRARNKNGDWHTIESIGKNMLDNPVINGVIITSRDITEHKQAQEALKVAKEEAEYANRSKTEFLANMSHELRTPLNAVIGFAGMIEKELYGPLGSEKYKESAAYIDESATHLLNLINDLLDVSKIEVGKMDMFEEGIDVGATVEQMLRMIEARATEAGVSVESQGFAGLPRLFADPRMLKQIILNLVSNAVKFTPRGGSVVVGAEVERSGALAITVRDTGIGMAEEDIPTALAAFGQIRTGTDSKYEGTGLGLPLTKSLIEMHGGEIEIESTFGVGTTVTVRYPASRVCQGEANGRILRAKAS